MFMFGFFVRPIGSGHSALRDCLRANEQVRSAYQQLKLRLSEQEFENGMAYSAAKDPFTKSAEATALKWYRSGLVAGYG